MPLVFLNTDTHTHTHHTCHCHSFLWFPVHQDWNFLYSISGSSPFSVLHPLHLEFYSYHSISFILVKLTVTFMLLYWVVNYHVSSQHLLMQLITPSLIGFLLLVLRTPLSKFSFSVIGASSQSYLLALSLLPDLWMLECPHISVLSPLLFFLYPKPQAIISVIKALNTICKFIILKFIYPNPDVCELQAYISNWWLGIFIYCLIDMSSLTYPKLSYWSSPWKYAIARTFPNRAMTIPYFQLVVA